MDPMKVVGHLATFLLARRRIEGLELLTADERLRQASGP
jgi:hypothetical protein